MTEIRTIKMVEEIDIKYIAEDGTEFTGENAKAYCETYERQSDEKRVTDAFNRLNIEKLNLPLIPWLRDYDEMWYVTLESKKEYYALYDYLKVVLRMWEINLELPIAFPYKTWMYIGEDYATIYHDDLKAQLQTALEKLK